jgi:hypothetical protein
MTMFDSRKTIDFVNSMRLEGQAGFRSVPGGPATLYGTCYALLTRYYLADDTRPDALTQDCITRCQIETGEFVGPELQAYEVPADAVHDREHLLHHLTCTVLPVCAQFNIPVRYPLSFARRFCDRAFLRSWLAARDLSHAWLEGNNLLFAGQLLVYLRDIEKHPGAQAALQCWFEWLDTHVDPATGLWGTNGHCTAMEAVYGGYHQLLVYYHERHPLPNPQGLVDTALSLQHYDGGFHPKGNGGACEDADCIDILVTLYKRFEYRRSDIRIALRRCLRHILALQNSDGGFPYKRNRPQTHMGIPGTSAAPNTSTAFATWFRVHTLALIAQVLPDDPALQGMQFRFTNNLSMGWHQTWTAQHARHTIAKASAVREKCSDIGLDLQHYLSRGRQIRHTLMSAARQRAGAFLRRRGLR